MKAIDRASVLPWEDSSVDKRVFGYIPRAKLKKEGVKLPLVQVYTRPCEQVPTGLGLSSFGLRKTGNGQTLQPLAVTSHFRSMPAIGRSEDCRDVAAKPNETPYGYVPPNPFRIIAEWDPQAWDFNLAEISAITRDEKGPFHEESNLALHYIAMRLVDTVLSDTSFLPPDDYDTAVLKWKDSLLLQREHTKALSQAERAAKCKNLGLSDSDSVTDKDRNSFKMAICKEIGGMPDLEALIKRHIGQVRGIARRDVRQLFLREMRLAEHDKNLTSSGDTVRTAKAKAERRKNFSRRAELLDEVFQKLGAGDAHPIEGTAGSYRVAHNLAEWNAHGHGSVSAWREQCYESMECLHTQSTEGEYFIGFAPGIEPLEDEEIRSKEFTNANTVWPSETQARSAGPYVDRVYRTALARQCLLKKLGRPTVRVYVPQERLLHHDNYSKGWKDDVRIDGLIEGGNGIDSKIAKKKRKVPFLPINRVLGDTSILTLMSLDPDVSSALHERYAELNFNLTPSGKSSSFLYQDLFRESAVQMSLLFRNVLLEIEAVRTTEIYWAWHFGKFYTWRRERWQQGLPRQLFPYEKSEDLDEEAKETRANFNAFCSPLLDEEVHQYDFFGARYRKYTKVHWSEQDRCLYLIAKPEAVCEFIINWPGIIRDAYIGQIYEWDLLDDTFDGKFKPMSFDFLYNKVHQDEDGATSSDSETEEGGTTSSAKEENEAGGEREKDDSDSAAECDSLCMSDDDDD